MNKVYPAILTNDLNDFKIKLKKISFAKIIQIDFCDGKFVKSKTLMPKDISRIKLKSKIECHLMINHPESKIKDFINLKPYSIIIHYGSTKNIRPLLQLIKSNKIQAGLALNPKTDPKKIIPYLKYLDFVLVMTVVPGKQGNKFLPNCVKKIKYLRSITKKPIEADGHIDNKDYRIVEKAGANILISGSYILNNKYPKKAYNLLLKR
jgi:ribulose-phosphate 3-epimerase